MSKLGFVRANEEKQIRTVHILTKEIRNTLENTIGAVLVKGEISNLHKHSSGHVYFTLKDQYSQISCSWFRQNVNISLLNTIDHGSEIIVDGDISVYEQRGQYQIIVKKIRRYGTGSLQEQFEILKNKLKKLSYFDLDRKKNLPKFIKKIAIITSPTGAALQDMLNVLNRRSPWINIDLYPSTVQGNGAEIEIANAINKANKDAYANHHESANHNDAKATIIIIARGGGSIEDLWAFNCEEVANAIFNSKLPIISAVGHETDFTIADFVADLRAPTPSAGAELASKDKSELISSLNNSLSKLNSFFNKSIANLHKNLEYYSDFSLQRPAIRAIENYKQLNDELQSKLHFLIKLKLDKINHKINDQNYKLKKSIDPKKYQHKWETLHHKKFILNDKIKQKLTDKLAHLKRENQKLNSLNPLLILKRGYSITYDKNGNPIKSTKSLKKDQEIISHFNQGKVKSKITNIEK